MSVENKKNLSKLVYFTLAILTLCAVAFFIYCLNVRAVATWARIIYYIWSGLVIGTVIFDFICTRSGEGKFVAGLLVYVLSVLAVVMACILYFANSGFMPLSADFFTLFISVSIVSLMVSGYLIATWCVGESLVEHATAQNELRK